MKEIFIALMVFALVGGGIAFGLRYRHEAKVAADPRPSIANFAPENLPENPEPSSQNEDADKEPADEKPDVSPTKPDLPATISLKVLNGGAPGGSAGKVASYLKTNGYSKAEAGNANGSNTGMVIYYSLPLADEAKVLQLLLLKEYKGVTAKPADEAKIPEAKTAPIVVVLGV